MLVHVACPCSVANKILILLKYETSDPFADLFNLSFSSGVLPYVLKIAKVVPVYKIIRLQIAIPDLSPHFFII